MVVGVLDHTHVAQQALRRQETRLLVQDRAQELVRRAEALHQDVALAVVHELHGLGNRLQFHRFIHDLEHTRVDSELLAGLGDQGLVTDKRHLHESQLRRLGASLDRVFVDRPGRDHFLADSFFLEFCKYISEFCNHRFVLLRLFF